MFGLICWVWRHVPEKDILGQQRGLSKNKTNNPSIMNIILLVLVRVVDTIYVDTVLFFSFLN